MLYNYNLKIIQRHSSLKMDEYLAVIAKSIKLQSINEFCNLIPLINIQKIIQVSTLTEIQSYKDASGTFLLNMLIGHSIAEKIFKEASNSIRFYRPFGNLFVHRG